MKSILSMTRQMVRSVATRGRLVALSALGLIGVFLAGVLRWSEGASAIDGAFLIDRFALTFYIPLTALVIATSTLGAHLEDSTLAYFWLRPIRRIEIAISGLLASWLVLLPLVMVPVAVIAAIAGTGTTVTAAVTAGVLSALAYGAVFTVLGLLTRRALVWGLVYVMLWEGVVAGLSRGAGRLALSSYSSSMLSRLTDVKGIIAEPSTLATCVAVAVGVVVVAVGATTFRLETMDVD